MNDIKEGFLSTETYRSVGKFGSNITKNNVHKYLHKTNIHKCIYRYIHAYIHIYTYETV